MTSVRLRLIFVLLITTLVQPVTAVPQSSAEQNLIRSITDSSWDGAMGDAAKGNSPAQLKIVMQKGSLTGFLTYAGFEETLSITVSAPSTIRLKGVSYRDVQEGRRTFSLDVLTGELSLQGHRLSGTAVDAEGTRSRFEFRRIR